MKSILLSIKPEWVEKILNREKTLEARKTRPKCELPCRVYMYCSKSTKYALYYINNRFMLYKGNKQQVNGNMCCGVKLNGKVAAEFTLNVIEDFEVCSDDFRWLVENTKCCLTMDEVLDYSKGQDIQGWYIDDLVIYDKPKELSEFSTLTKCNSHIAKSKLCDCCCLCSNFCKTKPKKLTRPPQSWCYVEEIK